MVKEIAKRRLMWAGHALRRQGCLVRQVNEEEPLGKIPLWRRPRLMWENGGKNDIMTI